MADEREFCEVCGCILGEKIIRTKGSPRIPSLAFCSDDCYNAYYGPDPMGDYMGNNE